MSQLPLLEPDDDLLPLLRSSSNKLLEPLVMYITNQGFLTSQIELLDIYKKNFPNHVEYVDEIAAEIQKFGGNTIANFFREGRGVLYKQIVLDVASQVGATHEEAMDVVEIEARILLRILEKAYQKMSEEERREFLKGLGMEYGKVPNALPAFVVQALLRGTGFIAYQLVVILANAVSRTILGRGLSLALNRFLTKSLNVALGPIGWAITALWAVVDIAGPAYRVTIPYIVHVAFLRQQALACFCTKGHYNQSEAKFCSECGESLAGRSATQPAHAADPPALASSEAGR